MVEEAKLNEINSGFLWKREWWDVAGIKSLCPIGQRKVITLFSHSLKEKLLVTYNEGEIG